jgi:hypothetical protein
MIAKSVIATLFFFSVLSAVAQTPPAMECFRKFCHGFLGARRYRFSRVD